jgi:hypothetical protein
MRRTTSMSPSPPPRPSARAPPSNSTTSAPPSPSTPVPSACLVPLTPGTSAWDPPSNSGTSACPPFWMRFFFSFFRCSSLLLMASPLTLSLVPFHAFMSSLHTEDLPVTMIPPSTLTRVHSQQPLTASHRPTLRP